MMINKIVIIVLLCKLFLIHGWTIRTRSISNQKICRNRSRLYVEKNTNYDKNDNKNHREEKRKKKYGSSNNSDEFNKMVYGNENDDNMLGNIIKELSNPYNSKIPWELQSLIQNEDTKTKQGKHRKLKITIYIGTFISCMVFALLNVHCTEIRSKLPLFNENYLNDNISNDDIINAMNENIHDPIIDHGFGWIYTNAQYEFLLLSNIGGYLLLIVGAISYLAASFEWDNERENMENIFNYMIQNNDRRLYEYNSSKSLMDKINNKINPKINKKGNLYAPKKKIIKKKKNSKKMKRIQEWNNIIYDNEINNNNNIIYDNENNNNNNIDKTEEEEKMVPKRRSSQFFEEFWNNDGLFQKKNDGTNIVPFIDKFWNTNDNMFQKKVLSNFVSNNEKNKKFKQSKEEKVYNDSMNNEKKSTTTEPPKEIELVLKKEKKKKKKKVSKINNTVNKKETEPPKEIELTLKQEKEKKESNKHETINEEEMNIFTTEPPKEIE